MLTADVIFTLEQSLPLRSPFAAEHAKAVNETYTRLTHDLLDRFRREGVPASRVRLRRSVLARYQLQVHELAVPVPARDLRVGDLERLAAAFEAAYERTYGAGSAYTEAGIELITFRVDGICAVPRPRPAALPARRRSPARAPKGTRLAHFAPPGRFLRAAVYDGAGLRPGDVVEGPAIVERMGDTVVIPPRAAGVVDRFTNLRVQR
jgi:N-methylhydantoinase A